MVSRTGWAALATGICLLIAGRATALIELTFVGAAALALVILAVLSVVLTRVRIDVAREVHPVKVHAGTTTRVELRVSNRSTRRTPVLRLRDPVAGTRGALVNLAPLPGGDTARAAYRLPTARRGLVPVGPLTVELSDPFGLARLTRQAAPRLEITVFPAVADVVPVTSAGMRDPHSGSEHPTGLSRHGDDFHGLRPYVVGDDLRRVHWPSTARHDDLMVRQDELPWQGRVTLLLDVRRSAMRPDALEAAVSFAASLVLASWKHRDTLRLLASDGRDSGSGVSHHHVDAILEYLATVEATSTGSLRSALDLLARPGSGGALVAVLGQTGPVELESLGRLRRRFSRVDAVVVGERLPGRPPRGVTLLAAPTLESLAGLWNRTMGGRPVAITGRGEVAVG